MNPNDWDDIVISILNCPKCDAGNFTTSNEPDTMTTCIGCGFTETIKYWKLPEHIQLWTDKLKEM